MNRNLVHGLASLGLALAASLGMSGTALAAEGDPVPCPTNFYPPNSVCTEASQSQSVVKDGEPITVTVRGFRANSGVTFYLYSTPVNLGVYVANAAGNVTATLTIPEGTSPGVHHIVASGSALDGSPHNVSIEITVVDDEGTGGGLPLTGAQIGLASALGAGLIGAGSAAVVAGRRRKAVATL